MSEDAQPTSGLIGPNAVLQLLPVLDRLGGPDWRTQILAKAGIVEVPDGTCMIPETVAARLHHQVRLEEPEMAPRLVSLAGFETANYILKQRIPSRAQKLLKALPSWAAARLLSRAIAQHAWTFVGSGTLHVIDPWTFEIEDNPLIKGEASDTCLCDWHVGVFARLYQSLVAQDSICSETRCGAQQPGYRCRFELHIGGSLSGHSP
ncbi:bacteriochlorophyll 4-vinyl reductase [Aestuariibius sp. 2305UL40-4]|uniref:bacteriochlorophyll 4-vinyl reductase n=1 Tax=Aestuariibius violaceus TaxID=3234132 RepID=UPI00345E46E3